VPPVARQAGASPGGCCMASAVGGANRSPEHSLRVNARQHHTRRNGILLLIMFSTLSFCQRDRDGYAGPLRLWRKKLHCGRSGIFRELRGPTTYLRRAILASPTLTPALCKAPGSTPTAEIDGRQVVRTESSCACLEWSSITAGDCDNHRHSCSFSKAGSLRRVTRSRNFA